MDEWEWFYTIEYCNCDEKVTQKSPPENFTQ